MFYSYCIYSALYLSPGQYYRSRRKFEVIYVGKEEVKQFFLPTAVCVENSKEFTKKVKTKATSNFTDTRSILNDHLYFYILTINNRILKRTFAISLKT